MTIRPRGGGLPRFAAPRGTRRPLPLQWRALRALALLTALFCIGFALLDLRIKPVISTIGLARAKALATISITRAVEEEFKENAEDYADLITLQTGKNGEVHAVRSDIVKINRLKARLSERVQHNLTLDMINVPVPLGNLLGGDLLSGRGPLIRFKLLPYGTSVVDVDNQFVSAGINQALHRIVLTVDAGISIVLPVSSVNAHVVTSVVVAETIIVGEVPESYANFEGLHSDAEQIVLEALT
ncbi:MAG: sporulation protein YunB [Clostridiales bacterium]|nr:sporulation protein YunB [Clostridiales bacterium]